MLTALFGLIAVIPYVGLIGTAGGLLLSIMWTVVLGLWLFIHGTGLKRLQVRVVIISGLVVLDILASTFPFLGELVSLGIMLTNTLLLWYLIKAVEKEDKEYNELQARKEKEFGRAKTMKQYQELQKQFAEEEKLLQERSILNKKHA